MSFRWGQPMRRETGNSISFVWGVFPPLLRDGNPFQGLHETDPPGKEAPGNQHRVAGEGSRGNALGLGRQGSHREPPGSGITMSLPQGCSIGKVPFSARFERSAL